MCRIDSQMKTIPEILLNTLCCFWEKVDKKSDSECWNWIGAISGGYGHLSIKHENFQAHRLSYYIHYNKDPGVLLVCHECDNRSCVNPHHLFLGTVSDNIQHGFDTGRMCQQGSLNGNAKLTEEHIKEIRELLNSMSQNEIAKRYNVSRTTITNFVNGYNWSNI